eukprot:gnl/Trimastix_PCT/436.p2 GENE.gnl/Trimastix_PCT/436~~gnl/Trimastix_PCT/436.p2  ORF type:complete len:161 (-),score=25.82 gnl/Trimastix_PCT/436:211-693(-)
MRPTSSPLLTMSILVFARGKRRMNTQTAVLVEDLFDIKDKDTEGKKFPKVSRIVCESENYDFAMRLDYNDDIYPMNISEKFSFALASALALEGDRPQYQQLIDAYDYVMHGKLYKFEAKPDNRVAVYASFGGLLMELIGYTHHLDRLDLDSHVYLLIRKV